MEGWLYMIRSSRLGFQYSRKRYFVLDDHHLKSFTSVPDSDHQELVRSAVIDSCIRVTDNGRESIQRKVLYMFTIYNISNHDDQLKLGATSPDEAARWIQSFQDVALKAGPNTGDTGLGCWKSPCRSISGSRKIHQINSIHWTRYSSTSADPDSSDIIAGSPWTIFGCQNGLRLFKEQKDKNSLCKDDHPALMAVGVVEATSEAIFQTLMSLGTSRSKWDFCFYRGSVVEHLDGHTDIIHKQFRSTWMPWGMKRRDMLLRRFWRRDDDGTYVILYHSVYHKRCPKQKGYVRACLKSGGYVISPTNQGKHSVVKHMLAIDWKFWRSYLKLSLARSITIKMLERIAALREMFKAKSGNTSSSDFSSGELTRDIQQCHSGVGSSNADIWANENTASTLVTKDADLGRTLSSLRDLNDADDEFFDVPELSDYDDHSEDDWTSCFGPECQDLHHSRLSTAAGFLNKVHDFAVQKRGYTDSHETESVDGESFCYGCTLLRCSPGTLCSSYDTADPSTFFIRGKSFLKDNKKVRAKGTLMQLVGADWIRSNKKEDDLGGRPNSIVQKYAAKGGPEFFLIVHFQIPGSTPLNLAYYYMTSTPLEEVPLLERFVNGDDAFRNSRFKLIPRVAEGPWIVKQTVRNKPYLMGQHLHIKYIRGKNYLEIDIDIGSSSLAKGTASFVFGYVTNLVMELGFVIQANTYEELPEKLIGTCSLNYLDPNPTVVLGS